MTDRSATTRLVLLRHAKTKPGKPGQDDFDRELNDTGVKQGRKLGKTLEQAGIRPDIALVSAAVRTRQTWALLAAKPPLKGCKVVVHEDIYHASVGDILKLIRELGGKRATAVVVGHEPTMAATAAHLAGPGSDETALAQVRVGVPTGAWSLLESTQPWAKWGRGSAVLLKVVRPEV